MTNKTISEIIDEALIQLQYGTMMSDNQEPMLTNNRDIAHEAITQAMLDALPEIIPVDAPSLGVIGDKFNNERLKNWRIGRNEVILEIRTAIKKRGE